MNTASLAPVYIVGIVLNAGALFYAASNEQWLFVVTFAFVMVYLGFRYRMIKAD